MLSKDTQHKRLTQADIAARLGISRATVSAALSGSRFVSPELKDQILRAVEELHYVPDVIPRSMKTNRTMTIGLVMPNILSPVWATIARGVADVARHAEFSTFIYDTDEQDEIMCAALRTLQEKRVDGIVLAPSANGAEGLSKFLEDGSIPVVLVDRELDGLELDSVICDGGEGTYQAVRHLLGIGRRRIGLINLKPDITTGRERFSGYRRALEQEGLPLDEQLVLTGGRGAQEGYRQTLELLALPTDRRPDAIMVASHLMTVGTLTALREHGLRVPDDLAVIGFDDTSWAPLLDPPLTVVNQPAYTMGAKAADILLARIGAPNEIDEQPKRVILPTTLVHRASCCRPTGRP